MDNHIRQIASHAPDRPGVYFMKDGSGRILYIGKAKSLKKRLASYFSSRRVAKISALMAEVRDIEYRLCPSESMAYLLEANLIHAHRPKYNVSLRDDKSFPFIRFSAETYPAVSVSRKKDFGTGVYIGPFTSARLLREALKVIRKNFPFRSCAILPSKPCMYYRLHLCPAPCTDKISSRDYAEVLKDMRLVLEGKTDELVRKFSESMQRASGERRFEDAARFRDKIDALGALTYGRQTIAWQGEAEELRQVLGLKKIPERIEAFDISNISGQSACGSMVSFWRGSPDKNQYRRFRIKTVEGIDDYKMLAEVVRRRYTRMLGEKLLPPDLILIDGGRSHLLTAQKELTALGLRLPLASIAKEKENIYCAGHRDAIRFPADTPALNFIRRIRDEAHRFAISYHHLLRKKKLVGK